MTVPTTSVVSQPRDRPQAGEAPWRLCVAPMMDWTDRHCRFFHRLLAPDARLYTEMVVAHAVILGDRPRLLGYDHSEHPVALQLGGSSPDLLAQAARIGVDYGYDEINLNCGCPSDRVQDGAFGACLMREPARVGDLVARLRAVVPASLPVTVKCRIGVDDQDPEQALDDFAAAVHTAGADALIVHARKAWLKGLSPKDNRSVPPLDYGRVQRLKRRWPAWPIVLNGGLKTLADCTDHALGLDGVMLGREAYEHPWRLRELQQLWFESASALPDRTELLCVMRAYSERHVASGGQHRHVSRHMLGLLTGQPGARRFRVAMAAGDWQGAIQVSQNHRTHAYG